MFVTMINDLKKYHAFEKERGEAYRNIYSEKRERKYFYLHIN